MKSVIAVARHPVAGQTIRYGLAGASVAAVYLGLPLLLSGAFGVAIQIAIPIAYLLAVTLHFNLQRHFVFRHAGGFALTARQQILRYAGVGAVQYPTTALATTLLPKALGVSTHAVFVCATLVISFTFFLVLRLHVFHPGEPV